MTQSDIQMGKEQRYVLRKKEKKIQNEKFRDEHSVVVDLACMMFWKW
jgi:hypothetical protein